MKLLKKRLKNFLCFVLTLSAMLCSIPSVVYAKETREVVDITLTGNPSIEFDGNKNYRINKDDLDSYFEQNMDNYYSHPDHFKFKLPSGVYINGEKEYIYSEEEDTYNCFITFDFSPALSKTYVIDESRGPEEESVSRDTYGVIYLKRNKTVIDIADEDLKEFKFTTATNYKVSKQALYDLFMSEEKCTGKDGISSINDITGYSFKCGKYYANVTDDENYVIIDCDTIVPATELSLKDYFGDIYGGIIDNKIEFYIAPKVKLVDLTLENSTSENYYNFYFSTDKVYRVNKQNFFDVYMASDACEHSMVESMDDVKEYGFRTTYCSEPLVAVELTEDPGYLYFDFSRLPRKGVYSFNYDGYCGKRVEDNEDLTGTEDILSDGYLLEFEIGFYVDGYIPGEITSKVDNATATYLSEGEILNAEELYIINININRQEGLTEYIDSNQNLVSINDVKIVDINNQENDLTDLCTYYHYLTESSASGWYMGSLLYLGNEFSEYICLSSGEGGPIILGVELPSSTMTYKDIVTDEIIHTQEIEEGQTNIHYSNDNYIGWYNRFNEKVDDSTYTNGTVLYGVPKEVNVTLIDESADPYITDESTLSLDNDYDEDDISTFSYSVNRTDIFNKNDYPLFEKKVCSSGYYNYVNNPEYNYYYLEDMISSGSDLYIKAIPKSLPINIYNNNDEKVNTSTYDNKLTLKYNYISSSVMEEIDFNVDKSMYEGNLTYIYEFDDSFKKMYPLIVGHCKNSNYEILGDLEEPYITGCSYAINNKSYIGDRDGVGATCTTESTNTYTVSAITHQIYIDKKDTLLETNSTPIGYTYMTDNVYNTVGGYNNLNNYKTNGTKGFTLYLKKISSFSDMKDFNGNYTSLLINHYYNGRYYAEYVAFIPSDDSIIFKYNTEGFKTWYNSYTFNTVEEYNNWLDTLSYDSDKDAYYLAFNGYSFSDTYFCYSNEIGLFNTSKVEFINSTGYDENNLSDYNYLDKGYFYFQIDAPVQVPYTKVYTTPALGHIWTTDWTLFDTENCSDLTALNPSVTDISSLLNYAENKNEYTLASLEDAEHIYYQLCDRASDAYEIKVVSHTHTPGEAHKENEVLPTCTVKGSYKWVVRCTECNEIISSEDKETDALGHEWKDDDWSTVNKDDVTNELYANAYNASSLDINDLDNNDLVKKHMCHRAQDAYELKVEHVHDYGNPKFIWSDDYTSCDAEFKCTINDDTKLIECTVTPERTEPTYNEDGKIVYTAECTFEGKKYTDKKTVPINKLVDTTAPNVKIIVLNETFNTLMNVLTFGHYTNESQTVIILAEDVNVNSNETPSGVKEIKYYISETGLTNEEVFGLREEDWITYSSFIIAPNRECFIYAKAVDNQNNTGYASTDGIVLDNEKPIISGVDNNTDYEDTRIEYTVYDKYLESVKIDGIDVDVNGTTVNSYINNDSSVENNHKPHVIVATDKAGNSITVTFTLSTHVHTPGEAHKEDEILPTCTIKGSYKWVIRCTECNEIISSEDRETDALGHIWHEDWEILTNPSEADFREADNSSKLDYNFLKEKDTVYKRLCNRAQDAYELKVEKAALTGTIGGQIIDKNGNPVKGAKVVIHSVERITYTDDEGKYIFNDVEAGDHKLWIYVKDIEICEVSLTIADESTSKVDSDNGSYDIYTEAKGTYVPVDAIGISVPGDPIPDKPPVAGDNDNTILYILSIAAILGIVKSKKKIIKVR